MSVSVSPDGGYRYYQKSVSDIEDDLNKEAQMARERQENEIEHLQANQAESLRNQQLQAEKTIDSVRKNAAEQVETERKRAAEEVQKLKAQTYDRLGRYNGEEANAARDQLKMAEREVGQIHAKETLNRAQAEEDYQHRLMEEHEKLMEESGKSVDAAKEDARKAYETLQAERRQTDRETVDRTKGSYDDLRQDAMEEKNLQRRLFERALNEIDFDHKHLIKQKDEAFAALQERATGTQNERLQSSIEGQRRAHNEETRDLRDSVKAMSEVERTREAAGREKAGRLVKDYESEFRNRVRLQDNRFDGETRKLKGEIADVERYLSRRAQDTVKEKEKYFTDLISKQSKTNDEQVKELVDTFGRDRKQMVTLNKRIEDTARMRGERQLDQSNAKTKQLLDDQAAHYQEAVRINAANDQEKIKELTQEVRAARGGDDPTKISPQAEASVRRAIVGDYEKVFAEIQNRADRSEASVRDNLQHRLQELKSDTDAEKRRISAEARLEKDTDRGRTIQFIQDAEFQRDTTIRNKETSHERETQKLMKAGALTIDEQRRQYEEIIENLHFDNTQRINAVKSDLEFQMKQNQREHVASYTALSRGFEKRLNDQKEQYEIVLANERFDAQKNMRELEKRHKASTDEFNRAAEQQRKEIEHQHKEKERTIAEGYEVELDKLRHANAALIQKKS